VAILVHMMAESITPPAGAKTAQAEEHTHRKTISFSKKRGPTVALVSGGRG
jgi:hypothetical protein